MPPLEPLPDSRPALRKALAAWAGLIFVLSVIPMPSALPREFAFMSFDSFAHSSFYAVLGALLLWALPRGSRFTRLVIAASAALAFGFAIEIIQHFLPWRSFEWKDALADLAGGSTGAVFAIIFPGLHLVKLTR